jgi:hypothetical protein
MTTNALRREDLSLDASLAGDARLAKYELESGVKNIHEIVNTLLDVTGDEYPDDEFNTPHRRLQRTIAFLAKVLDHHISEVEFAFRALYPEKP